MRFFLYFGAVQKAGANVFPRIKGTSPYSLLKNVWRIPANIRMSQIGSRFSEVGLGLPTLIGKTKFSVECNTRMKSMHGDLDGPPWR